MTLTIYERNGGFPQLRRVVTAFYDRVLDSPVVAHHFEQVDIKRLIEHQTRFISFLTGGPAPGYTDEHLAHVHSRFEITLDEFDEMVELLTETLEDFDFEADDISEIRNELRKREPVIVSGR